MALKIEQLCRKEGEGNCAKRAEDKLQEEVTEE